MRSVVYVDDRHKVWCRVTEGAARLALHSVTDYGTPGPAVVVAFGTVDALRAWVSSLAAAVDEAAG
jgi:hypothetical protein